MKYIISASQDGLAGRIFCLINSIYIAENNNLDIKLYWDRDVQNRFDLDYGDIFDKDFPRVSKEELKRALRKKEPIIHIDGRRVIPRKEIIRILKSLRLKQKFKKVQDSIDYDYGFHIRRGDFVEIGNVKASPLKLFDEIYSQNKSNGFLASDDLSLKKRYKNLDTLDKKEPIYDLLALSKCKKIYCSYGSGFSELAEYLGECNPERIVLVDKKELEKLKRKEEGKSYGFIGKIKSILYENLVPIEKRFFRVRGRTP